MDKYSNSLRALVSMGFNFHKGFYELDSYDLSTICDQMKADKYKYVSTTGQSTLYCYYRKMQRLAQKEGLI